MVQEVCVSQAIASDFRDLIAERIKQEHRALATRWLERLNELLPVEADEIFPGDGLLDHIPSWVTEIGEYLRAEMGRSLMSKIGYLFAKGAFDSLKKKMDPNRSNGGVFLGLNGIVIKSHGGTNAFGFSSAVDIAYKMARHGLIDQINQTMSAFHGAMPAAPILNSETSA